MMFDAEGNELRATDRSGNEVTNARGTEAYHSLPTDQKMVILDGQKEVTALAKALKATMGDKDFAVVCHLSFRSATESSWYTRDDRASVSLRPRTTCSGT
ncbi:hypothetical protein FRC19_010566 [Serendipita sp. 401]|nr:hypothetical protein FRC19_010566 [Serendipita sp. 401]